MSCYPIPKNNVSFVTATEPAVEPVSLSDMKDYLRVDGSTEDDLITSLIVAGRRMAERYTGKRFITQTVKMTLDRFPYGKCHGQTFLSSGNPVRIGSSAPLTLISAPLQSVTSITTYTEDNSSSVFASSNYQVDKSGGRVYLNTGVVWPVGLRDFSAVEVLYVVGYGDAATDVPDDIITAIKQIVQVMYETRETECQMPCGASALLGYYKEPKGRGYVDNGMC